MDQRAMAAAATATLAPSRRRRHSHPQPPLVGRCRPPSLLFVDVVPRRAVKLEVERLGNSGVSKKGTDRSSIMSPLNSLKIQTLRHCTVAYFVFSWRDCYPRRSCPSVWSSSPRLVSSQHRNDLAGIALSPSATCPLPRSIRTAAIHCTFDRKLDSLCKTKILFHTLHPPSSPDEKAFLYRRCRQRIVLRRYLF